MFTTYDKINWKTGQVITVDKMNKTQDKLLGLDLDTHALAQDIIMLDKKVEELRKIVEELRKIVEEQTKTITHCKKLIDMLRTITNDDMEDEDHE